VITIATISPFVGHFTCCALMTGVCLFVAVVHYPLMARVGRDNWIAYERAHTDRTGYVVAPIMLAEAALAAWVSLAGAALPMWWWINLAGLAVCWAITFGVNVPQHVRLAKAWDDRTYRALVAMHWVRTLVWLARTLMMVLFSNMTGSGPGLH